MQTRRRSSSNAAACHDAACHDAACHDAKGAEWCRARAVPHCISEAEGMRLRCCATCNTIHESSTSTSVYDFCTYPVRYLPQSSPRWSERNFSDQWISFHPGDAAFVALDGHCVKYVPTYKAANFAIRENLRQLVDRWNLISNGPRATYTENVKYVAEYKTKNMLCKQSTFTFTFVRNPADRLISGLSEYFWRQCLEQALMSVVRGNEREFQRAFCRKHAPYGKALVQNVVYIMDRIASANFSQADRDAKRTEGLNHIMLMSGVLSHENRFDAIGHLEMFDRDWEVVTRKSRLPVLRNSTFDKELGQHSESSGDILSVVPILKELFRQRPTLARKLCYELHHDFRCFRYDPIDCFAHLLRPARRINTTVFRHSMARASGFDPSQLQALLNGSTGKISFLPAAPIPLPYITGRLRQNMPQWGKRLNRTYRKHQ